MKKVFKIEKRIYLFNLYTKDTDLGTHFFGFKGEQPLVLHNDIYWELDFDLCSTPLFPNVTNYSVI